MVSPIEQSDAPLVLSRLLSPTEAGRLLKIPVGTLANWRSAGKGPDFVRVGRHVRYRVEDLLRWIEGQTERPESVPPHW